MRILYASTLDLHQEKASTIHFLALARALQDRKHQVTLVSRPTLGLVEFLGSLPLVGKLKVLLYDALVLLILLGKLMREHFEVLYHRDVPLINVLAHLFKVPTIVEVNGIYVDELKAAGMHPLGVRLYQVRERAVVQQADRIVCVTQGIREQLVARYAVPYDRCVVIPNATDTSAFIPLDKKQCRASLELPDWDYHIGFVGKFQPWIDFETLLQAMRMLQDKNIPVHCTLIGNGSRYHYVEQLITQLHLTGSVHLTGYVPHGRIVHWIGAFDTCVAPFTHTRNANIGLSPMKIFEYMACGRPVIATNLPGITEVIAESQGGLLYEIGNAESLARQIASLHDAQKREAMGQRGREYVVKHHSWGNVARQVEEIVNVIRDS